MSSPAFEQEPVCTNENERQLLDEIEHFLASQRNLQAKLTGPDGAEVFLPESLLHVLRRAVEVLSEHGAVLIVPVQKQLTTSQAAEILNVSRPYLVRLLNERKIPFTKTGTHRRIKFGDIMAYREGRHEERRKKLADLTRMSQEIGLYS